MELNKAAETKKHIMETAFRLFLQKGYHGTAMSDLVAQTGLSKGAFYYHFKGKDTLYKFVVETYLLPVFVQSNLDTIKEKDLQETVAYLLSSYQETLKAFSHLIKDSNARYYSFFFEAFQEVPEFRDSVQGFYTSLKRILSDKFQFERGMPRDEAERKAVNYIARCEGMIFWTAIFPNDNGAALLEDVDYD